MTHKKHLRTRLGSNVFRVGEEKYFVIRIGDDFLGGLSRIVFRFQVPVLVILLLLMKIVAVRKLILLHMVNQNSTVFNIDVVANSEEELRDCDVSEGRRLADEMVDWLIHYFVIYYLEEVVPFPIAKRLHGFQAIVIGWVIWVHEFGFDFQIGS